MKKLIDRDEILSFPNEEYSGFCNFVWDLINKYNFNDREDDAMEFAEEILESFMNVVRTAEVVEEREEAKCLRHYDKEGNRYIYICDKCLEDITTPYGCEEFKFCPNCGAKYVELIKEKELCGMI